MMDRIEELRSMCVSCGACSDACPSFAHGGIDPMGFMSGEEQDLSQCISCGCCSRACPVTDPFTAIRLAVFTEKDLKPSQAFLETGFARRPAEDRCIGPVWTGDDVHVMIGCVVDSEVPYVEYAASRMMQALGYRASRLPGEMCCLHPVMFMGMPDGEKERLRRGMIDRAEGRRIVTLCAGCSGELSPLRDGISHVIGFLHENIDRLPRFSRRIAVGMEPGCSAEELSEEMREVLEAMGCEVVNRTFGCCGKNAPVRVPLMLEREAECEGAELIVVGCPNCLAMFDRQEGGLPTVHIAELVAMAAGYAESARFHRIAFERSSFDPARIL